MTEFEKLLEAYGNLSYDCGHRDSADLPDNGFYEKQLAAKQAVIDAYRNKESK